MNLNNISAYDLERLDLPDAALLALRDGKEWEYQPETIDGAEADVHYCESCDGDGLHGGFIPRGR
jgi:hypothetical protein